MKLLLLLFLPHILFAMDTTWWKHTIVYEVLIWSFKDSNGDGVGDLKGITQKLDHFVDMHVETIYITPFCESPMVDMGYDVANYTAIEPLFGTMDDFDQLINESKKRGLKLIADLVINHSSDEHPWFQKSIDRIEPYTDFYVWVDPKGYDRKGRPLPPNNWVSVFGGSMWEWNNERKQFYLHQFAKKQPDLNLRNDLLVEEIKNIMKFWLDRGISGFRLDAAKHFFEDPLLRDEPPATPIKKELPEYEHYVHIYTTDLWDVYEFIHKMRLFMEDHGEKTKAEFEKILIVESYSGFNETMLYYGNPDFHVTHFPFGFDFALLNDVIPAKIYDNFIQNWLQNMPKGETANWVADNHDRVRVNRRLGEEYMDIVIIFQMTLPGVACVYYGQEIGMTNLKVRSDQRQDQSVDVFGDTRDGERLPMQWDDSLNAGFSTGDKTWLPVHPNYWQVNVKSQKAEKYSRYNMFKTLSKLRKSKVMKNGNFTSFILSKWVYAYARTYKNYKPCVVIFNLGTEMEYFDLNDAIQHLPPILKVVTASLNAGYKSGDHIRSSQKFPHVFSMKPSSAIVLTSGDHRKSLQVEENFQYVNL